MSLIPTAQVFMTCRDILEIFHEPFGDAFYYGPEKISPAHLRWPTGKIEKSGRGHYTYNHVLQGILDAVKISGKRVFLKDMSYHIIPPIHSPDAKPPSLHHLFTPDEAPNPTLFPTSILRSFQFVFLIRKPSSSMPSLYRCFIPPLSNQTDEHTLDSTELGYREMRILFDYLYPSGAVSTEDRPQNAPLLIDADDFLSNPDAIIRSLCSRLSIPYSPSMLTWDSSEDHAFARSLFDKYAGYHEDALNSTGLRPKPPAQGRSTEEEEEDWKSRYGSDAARTIREAVDLCQADYEYLRQFKIRP